MRKRTYTDAQFAAAVANNQSISRVLKALGLRPAGGNYKAVHLRVKALALNTAHWTGQAYLKGKGNPYAKRIPLKQILVKDSTYTNTNLLRKRLLAEGYFERKCYSCAATTWLERPIPLELEHINGNNCDHRRDNLTLLCPNCHALTATYRGRNIKHK